MCDTELRDLSLFTFLVLFFSVKISEIPFYKEQKDKHTYMLHKQNNNNNNNNSEQTNKQTQNKDKKHTAKQYFLSVFVKIEREFHTFWKKKHAWAYVRLLFEKGESPKV